MNSLGLPKRPKHTRVVVAMSGGVDSSVTAALLKGEGYEVVGVTLQLYNHGSMVKKRGSCCAGQDIYDAKEVANQLGIRHYVFDYEHKFRKEVIDEFADSYLKGETPVPCVRCNQTVKFRDLLESTKNLKADVLATGHYVQRVASDNCIELHKGASEDKDQSYFLFSTTMEQLEFLRFPLGGLTKIETRSLAQKFQLTVADKPDSQDICFVPNGNYAEIVANMRPEGVSDGDIVHIDGSTLGRHEGIINFTVGQRRGLRIGGGIPLYVVEIQPETKRVIVGPREALLEDSVYLREVNWIGDCPLEGGTADVQVKLRSLQPVVPATVNASTQGVVLVKLHDPQIGVAPGQACVFYDHSRVLGGGWISKEIQIH